MYFFFVFSYSQLKVRYPKRAASRYMMNMARNDTLATPCIFLRERLLEQKRRWVVEFTYQYTVIFVVLVLIRQQL